MNTNYLMRADWVLYNDNPYRISIISNDFVTIINEKLDDVDRDDIEPIPITPEILEKNGFKKEIYDNWLGAEVFESENKQIQIMNLSHFIGRDWHIHIDNEDMETIGCSDIQYVHEMQHALKLFGIDMDIVL